MKYYYEYKRKNGTKVFGCNLEKIEIYDDFIRLLGTYTIQSKYYEEQSWVISLDMNEIEYLKIEPMVKRKKINLWI